ncbi:hypothetical protein B0J14DRAFT_639134 [Halenospora varia]|nr:hypothetical protein B0J14DRAFT_639134 [Halenospora varia]
MVPRKRKDPEDASTAPAPKKRTTNKKPKTAPATKSARTSKATASKAAKPKRPPPSHTRSDSSPPPNPCPGYPEPTTQAQRDRARFKISQKSLYHETSTPDDIAALAATLSQNGTSSATWGFTSQSPILGTTRPQVREIIYEYVMCAGVNNSVMVGSDWSRLEFVPTALPLPSPSPLNSRGKNKQTYKPSTQHNILKVCKQFAREATAFLYANTTWTAIVKPVASVHLQRLYDRHDMFLPSINPDLNHLFKDCVLEVRKNCWTVEHYKEITRSISTLHRAGANLNSLTITFYAERKFGLMSTTVGGLETNPVSFSDFLCYPNNLMRAIRKLCPKIFKVVMKIAGGRKFDFVTDMRSLRAQKKPLEEFSNEEAQLRKDGAVEDTEVELMGLEALFVEVYQQAELDAQEQRLAAVINSANAFSTSNAQEGASDGDENTTEVGGSSKVKPAPRTSASSSFTSVPSPSSSFPTTTSAAPHMNYSTSTITSFSSGGQVSTNNNPSHISTVPITDLTESDDELNDVHSHSILVEEHKIKEETNHEV